MRFENYLVVEDVVTYELYCHALDHMVAGTLDEGIVDFLKDKSVKVVGKIKDMFGEVKTEIDRISSEIGIEFRLLVTAFKDMKFFEIFKQFGYTFHRIVKAVFEVTTLFRNGLHSVFKSIEKTNGFQKFRAGVITIDELMEKHPLLKKITGPAIAGLLFMGWLNMTFIGDLDYDFNFSDIGAALAGKYSLADLFASSHGLMFLTLVSTGNFISVAWLGKTSFNLILALTYTLLYKANVKGIPQEAMAKMRKRIKMT